MQLNLRWSNFEKIQDLGNRIFSVLNLPYYYYNIFNNLIYIHIILLILFIDLSMKLDASSNSFLSSLFS